MDSATSSENKTSKTAASPSGSQDIPVKTESGASSKVEDRSLSVKNSKENTDTANKAEVMEDKLEKRSEESRSCDIDDKIVKDTVDIPKVKADESEMDEKKNASTADDKVEATVSKNETVPDSTDNVPNTDKEVKQDTEVRSTTSDADSKKATVENKDEGSSKEDGCTVKPTSQISDSTVKDEDDSKESTKSQTTTDQDGSAEPQKSPEDDIISSSIPTVASGSKEWDEVSGVSMRHLSFILDHFLPTWHPTVNNTHWDAQKDKVLQLFKAKYVLKDQTDVELGGDLIIGLYVPPYHEKSDVALPDFEKLTNDLMKSCLQVRVIAKEKQVLQTDLENYDDLELYPFFALNNGCHEGFLKVQPIDETAWNQCTVEEDGQKYLSSDKVKEAFASGGLFSHDDQKDDEKFESTETEGFALNQAQVQVALLCPAWPKQAEEWEDRARPSGWPSQETRKDILQTKCLIQPVAHPRSQWKEAEWAYDFSTAETMLAKSLTLTQRQCYMLLHIMAESHLQAPPTEITSILKSIFFRSMEKIPADHWKDKATALARCSFFMLEELYHGFNKHKISHYFVAGNNVIDHIEAKAITQLKQRIKEIRKDLLKHIFAFDQRYKFPFSVKGDYEEQLKAIAEDLVLKQRDTHQTQLKQLIVLEKLVSAYIQDEKPQGAVETAEEMRSIFKEAFQNDLDVVEFLHSMILNKFTPEIGVASFDYIIEHYHPEGSFLSNTACQYVSLYCAAPPGPEKEKFGQKADDLFRMALGSEYRSVAAGMADYAVFLLAAKRYEEAITLLHQIIEKEADNPTFSNGYEANEKCTLDEYLQEEIDKVERLSSPALLLAYYHLIRCYAVFKWDEEAEQLMMAYEQAAEACFKKNKDPQIFSLVGYSYMVLGNFYKAFNHFAKALEAAPKYNLARENMKRCLAQQRKKAGVENQVAQKA